MFNERTHLHTNANLIRILDGAALMGELSQLYWMVEIKIAAKLAGTKNPVIAAASYPLGWVPVVAVGSDPKRSRHDAELLLECLKSANRGRLIDFGLALTSRDVIDGGGYQAYEWGDARWDCVCVACGAVWQSTGVGQEVCGECIDQPTKGQTNDVNE
jgi:hypothetical protein